MKMRIIWTVVGLIGMFGLISCGGGGGSSAGGTFTAGGTLNVARTGFTTTLLPSGKVLVAGGDVDGAGNTVYASAELYDPATDTWSLTGSMTAARGWHSAILLSSGKVLVVGGLDNGNDLSSCELFDPTTGTWSTTGSLVTARSGANMVLLSDGKALIAGGHNGAAPNETLSSAELYDPTTGTWSTTGDMTMARRTNSMNLLPNGKVLVAGGTIKYTTTVFDSAELYDPVSGTWTATGSMNTARIIFAATLLSNGKLLVTGGSSTSDTITPLASAELYDPATEVWTATASMSTARAGAAASMLSDGTVLLAGGTSDGTDALSSAELYDSATGTWSDTGSMSGGRVGSHAVELSSGKVLLVGGMDASGILATSELYNP